MPLTDEQKAALLAELRGSSTYADTGSTDGMKPTPELVHLLCLRPQQPNPTPDPGLPAPFDAAGLLGCIAAESRPNIRGDLTGTGGLVDLIVRQDRHGILVWASYLASLATGGLTSGDLTAIETYLAQTVPTPGYPATVDAAPAPLQRVLGTGVGLLNEDLNALLGRPNQ